MGGGSGSAQVPRKVIMGDPFCYRCGNENDKNITMEWNEEDETWDCPVCGLSLDPQNSDDVPWLD